MPIEITDAPKSEEQFAQVAQQAASTAMTLELTSAREALPGIQEAVNRDAARLKEQFEDLPEEQLDTILSVIYGPLILPPEILHTEKLEDIRDKESSARFQQTLAHYIFRAASNNADPEFTKQVYDWVLDRGSKISRLAKHRGAEKIVNLQKGYINQLAITKSLHEGGYRIYNPDYSQDPYEVEDEYNEVLQLDVKHGVDLIAVKDGRVMLIDAKGRIENERVKLEDGRAVDINFEPSQLLRVIVEDFNPTSVYRGTIYIPTARENFLHPVLERSPDEPKKLLRAFAKLAPNHEDDIIKIADSIDMIVGKVPNRRFDYEG